MLAKPPGRSGRPRPASSSNPPSAPGQVRIIGGSLRGSRLPVPQAHGLRPTPDRVRETLFNWLRPRLPGARVLDLFAGSGALGIEAHSQGAGPVTLIERDAALASHLKTQCLRLKIPADAVRVVHADALTWLRSAAVEPLDLALLDPPYALELWQPALSLLLARGWLKEGALVYLEWPRERPAPQPPAGWDWHRQTQAGGLVFGLLAQGA